MQIEKLILNTKPKKIPLLVFSSKAYNKIQTYLKTDKAKSFEFMFVGNVELTSNEVGNIYLVTNTEIIPQCKNSSVYCETDDEKYTKWLMEQPVEVRKTIRLHGHSHVNMATSPSGTDNDQILNMMNYVSDFFIQLIYNHKGDFTINIYDKKDMLIYKNIDLLIQLESGVIYNPSKKELTYSDTLHPEYDKENNHILLLGDYYYINVNTKEFIAQDDYITISNTKGITINVDKDILKDSNDKLNSYITTAFNSYSSYSSKDYFTDYPINEYNYRDYPLDEDIYDYPLVNNYKKTEHTTKTKKGHKK